MNAPENIDFLLDESVLSHRPIIDAMYSIVAHGMLSRFPGIKAASVENGSYLAPACLLEDFRTVYAQMPQEFAEDPVEVFMRQVWVNPFWEDPVDELVGLIGADRVLFGSDWPHGECLDEPLSWVDFCAKAGIAAGDVEKMMGANLSGLMGIVPAAA